MNTAFVEAIGDLFTESFAILRFLGDGFNYFIMVVMFIMAVIWIKKMADFGREAERNGTLK